MFDQARRLAAFIRLAAVVPTALGLAISSMALGAPKAKDLDHVTVIWSGAASDDWSDPDVAATCSAFADALLVGHGHWGIGVFHTYGCVIDGRLVAGEQGEGPWSVLVEPSSTDVSMTLLEQRQPSRAGEPPTLERVYGLKLTPAFWLREFSRDPEHARLLAAPFLLSLPAHARLDAAEFATGFRTLQGVDDDEAATAPPRRVLLHDGRAPTGRITSSDPIGRGVLMSESPRSWRWWYYDQARVLPGDDLLVTATDAIEVRAELTEKLARLYAAGARSENPYALLGVEKTNGSTAAYVSSSTVAPVAIALRYGQDIGGSDVTFGEPTRFTGFIAEARAGAFQGLRLEYDNVPTVESEDTGAAFGARLAQAGWAFGWKLPAVFDRIDLTPKLGLWNLESRFLLRDPSNGQNLVVPVDVNRTFGVGLEVGVEMAWRRLVVRTWGSQTMAVPAASRVQDETVVGTRYGVDALFRLVELGERRSGRWLAPLLFLRQDEITISSTSNESVQTGDRLVEFEGYDISYVMTYVGGGLGVIF